VQLLQQVAKGLDAAHALRDARGERTPLIHRDLKPENLLLVPRNHGSPLVKILDFGISKVLSESRNMSHEIRGTPMYMAYEQVAAEKLSPQTDIWPLGLIAYYMLTGRRYWKSANDPEASMQALFMEILMAPMAPANSGLQSRAQISSYQNPSTSGWLAVSTACRSNASSQPRRRSSRSRQPCECSYRRAQRCAQRRPRSLHSESRRQRGSRARRPSPRCKWPPICAPPRSDRCRRWRAAPSPRTVVFWKRAFWKSCASGRCSLGWRWAR
jgi:serine/threonine protein kinase